MQRLAGEAHRAAGVGSSRRSRPVGGRRRLRRRAGAARRRCAGAGVGDGRRRRRDAARSAGASATAASGGTSSTCPASFDARARRIEDVAAPAPAARTHVRRDRIGLRVVVDVDVEAVHHVEARVAEQLLQRRALQRPRRPSAAGTRVKSESSVSDSTGGSGARRRRRGAARRRAPAPAPRRRRRRGGDRRGGSASPASRARPSSLRRDQRLSEKRSGVVGVVGHGGASRSAARRRGRAERAVARTGRCGCTFRLRLGLVVLGDERRHPRAGSPPAAAPRRPARRRPCMRAASL